MTRDEIQYRILSLIESSPEMSQREIARELGVSLGKINYVLKALVEKGFIKAHNFAQHPKKLHYRYLLTPSGIDEKTRITLSFLRRKVREYHEIKSEISRLKSEVPSEHIEDEILTELSG